MKQWYPLYVFLYSYLYVRNPDQVQQRAERTCRPMCIPEWSDVSII